MYMPNDIQQWEYKWKINIKFPADITFGEK